MRTCQKGGTPAGLTQPEVAAAKRLVHLGGDEEERDRRGANGAMRGLAPAVVQVEGEEDKGMAGAIGVGDFGGDGDNDGDDADKTIGTKKRKFRSLAHIYKVTKPVGPHGEPKKRKQWQMGSPVE